MASSLEDQLPFVGSSALPQTLSWLAAVFMTALSTAGLIFPQLIYPEEGLAQDFLTNDLVNLLVGLPFLVGSLWLLGRKRLSGVLLLPGALVYVIYNYLAYALGRPWDWFAALSLGLTLFSAYLLIDYLRRLDHQSVKNRLEQGVPRRISSWVLIAFGGAFFLLAASQVISGIREGSIPPLADQAVSVADLLVSALWMIGGILMLRKNPLGYSAGLGLLAAASSLFIGLILFMVLSPLFTGSSWDIPGLLTVLPMSLIALVPTYLFWRGTVRGEHH